MNNKDKNKKDIIIKIILIVIIILLLLHNCCVYKRIKNEKIPTGNVDIIEISCDKDDTCTTDDDKKDINDNFNKNNNTNKNNLVPKQDNNTSEEDNATSDNGESNKPNKPSDNTNNNDNSDDTEEPVSEEDPDINENDLIVRDKEIKWSGSTDAKIFTNSMYQLEDIIAPETSNTYQFVVKNRTDYNLKYNITFNEDNYYNINMKYKLKKNDTYIVDHYVSASELDINDYILSSGNNDTYYLEWKWISSSNDTEIGANPNSKYSLKIEVKAESI